MNRIKKLVLTATTAVALFTAAPFAVANDNKPDRDRHCVRDTYDRNRGHGDKHKEALDNAREVCRENRNERKD